MLLQELVVWKLKLLTFINGIPQFVLVATLIVLVLLLFKKKTPTQPWWKDVEWPFYAKQLLSQPEQVLFHRLINALPDHIVLAQVQVSQVLGVKKGVNFYEWNNRINRLSYDFVICRKDCSVVAVIELDDKSHESKDRIEADKRKDRATASAGIRMIRWHVKSMPDEITIVDTFITLLPTEVRS
ncbi:MULTISPECIES: DUF2726 domain-containing protein [unclassified Methylophilus]|uniref:DUF2726 domain-containing protein n=1 Tax=unclassified Methylophilus TaxID=2630143 RepID=UPI0003623AC1|nr:MULTISPECIES: DUF2726 domain-containing protein [unclassified Methylophilus]